jgi:hypothetical protein
MSNHLASMRRLLNSRRETSGGEGPWTLAVLVDSLAPRPLPIVALRCSRQHRPVSATTDDPCTLCANRTANTALLETTRV